MMPLAWQSQMQAVQLCRQLGLTPRRALRVVAWMNEENSGSASKTYLAEYESSLSNHVGAIESDLGAGHPLGFIGAVAAYFPRTTSA